MQVFVIMNNIGIVINADVNAKNWLKKKYVIKDLFGIQAIVNETISHVRNSCRVYIVLFLLYF